MSPSAGQSVVGSRPLESGRQAVLVLLMAALWVRPLIPESPQRGPTPFAAEADTVWTATTTVALDTVTLSLAVAVALWPGAARAVPRAARLGLVLLLAAAVVSSSVAGDRRSAVNSCATLLCFTLAALSLLRSLNGRYLACLLLAGVLASGFVNAAKCVSQGRSELADTLQFWLTVDKPKRLAAGADANSPELVNYERRLRSQNAFGYLFHPNVTGSLMAATAVLAAGLLAGLVRVSGWKLAPRVAWLAATIGALVIFGGGIHYTDSKGAIAAVVLGIAVLIAVRTFHSLAKQRPRILWAVLVGGYLLLMIGGIGYGTAKGTLPGASLAFRWEYWTTAAKVYADAPLTGVGGHNFAAGYLLHKSPGATEDIENPHSLWLSLLVELGPLGLLAGALLAGGAVWIALRGYANSEAIATDGAAPRWLAGIALAAFALLHGLWTDWPLASPGVGFVWAIEVVGMWAVVLVGAAELLFRLTAKPAGAAVVCAAIVGALAVLLTHGLVDFALLTPAGLAVLVGLAVAGRGLEPIGSMAPQTPRIAGRAVVGLALIAVQTLVVLIPSIRSASTVRQIELAAAKVASNGQVQALEFAPTAVLAADPWDPLPLTLLAQADLQLSEILRRRAAQPADELLKSAAQAIRLCVERFPGRATPARVRAEVCDALDAAGLRGAIESMPEAASAWERAVALQPQNPRMWLHLGAAAQRAEKPAEAHAAFKKALEIDDSRPVESPIRLSAVERRAALAGAGL